MREDLMVQQQVENLWQHFVGVICLNQTGRIQVKRVLPEFFDRWPTPEKFLRSRKATVINVIKSLGFYNRRENAIRKMTKDFLTWDKVDATKLYGIGKYGSDSYELFYNKRVPENVGDHELKRYIKEEFYGV
jgi:methyl-CpG-binding domain protein 4|tara:strand:+ start:874 stop:1269 length:396 start_codon:yes stop_codon:yes gene_type:complete